jgi:hypothetical protein
MSTPLPDATNVVKLEILGRINLVPCVNVLHFRRTAVIAPGDVATLTNAAKAAWMANVATQQHNQYFLNFVRGTDLTSTSGEQATSTAGGAGSAGGAAAPASACQVITIRTAVRSRSARGRVYLGGLPGSQMANAQEWTAVYTGALLTAFSAFAAACQAAGGAASWQIGVLSYYLGTDPTTGRPERRITPLFTPATGYTAEPKIESQRRRIG